ncbi:CDP-diacylglycerol--glycerol-3-phosphate 3-phosphatidyltransferase [Leucobacter manosquensis]|uniref:CDP-diacylglycerol--glycerol-3-phosphate 3-phosphatidyltransferase n=1 Tax=Leucobacter manosquensis TaxID=2810611 RepID=A0ABS5M0S4_9MICO|nr:CDP-diacylglycerol--glycerol-3-phosphate 3-phosphatidyltransferase [Leucobacter manosquensis]MBS3180782.1 CDP-diacylglycerol--glycerol-3-phosphate 3-phosphatidyltransferase [Leucobacter manosquensis]
MTGNAPASAAPSNWNAPNIITGARIIATPFFLWMLLADGGADGPWRWASAVFFVLAIATDAWDGHIARSRGLITDLGKLLDPIADKFLTGAALVGLSILAELPWWVTILILVREIGITVHRLLVAHDVVLAAAWAGKLKTVAQSVAITLALLPLAAVVGPAAPVVVWVNIITMAIAFVLTMYSGIDYVVGYLRARRSAQ